MRSSEDGGAVYGGIERRVGGKCEEKEERGDAQQETDKLVQTPVLGWRKNLSEKCHVAATALREEPTPPVVPLQGQSLIIMPRSEDSYNAGKEVGWRVGYRAESQAGNRSRAAFLEPTLPSFVVERTLLFNAADFERRDTATALAARFEHQNV